MYNGSCTLKFHLQTTLLSVLSTLLAAVALFSTMFATSTRAYAADPPLTYTTVASFPRSKAATPMGKLAIDSKGNLYGTTKEGGESGDGTVFKLTAGSREITVLASFDGNNGAFPETGVVIDNQGNLFGTTDKGGVNGAGVVYEVVAGSGQITVLQTFPKTQLHGSVVVDSAGNVYGTTLNGADGIPTATVFKIAAGQREMKTIATFTGGGAKEVHLANHEVAVDADGTVYGTSRLPNAKSISLFRIVPGTANAAPLLSLPYPATYSNNYGDVFIAIGPDHKLYVNGYVFKAPLTIGSKPIKTMANGDEMALGKNISIDQFHKSVAIFGSFGLGKS